MSLIQFRGRPILPPVIKHEEETEIDLQIEEDEIILSLPTSEALKAILCGLPDHLKHKLYMKEKNEKLMEYKNYYKDRVKHGENENCGNKGEKNTTHASGCKKKDNVDVKADEDQINNSSVSASRFSYKESKIKEQLVVLPEESRNNSETKPSKSQNCSSPLNSSKSIIGITNNQKLKALKSSGTNSSSYLQDYLMLLTSRSELFRVGKPKRETDLKNDVFLERRGSAPSLSGKKYSPISGRQRNSSGSSDKSSSSRSLGSTYLDSYLGTLTDHSWIIYPTGETDGASHSRLSENSENSKSLDSKDDDYLQRRLRFINPEKFFSADSKSDNIEEQSHSTCVIKSSSSAEIDNDTSGIVLSPDISSSSLDTDKLDSNAFSTSLQETCDIKESPKSQDLSESKESNPENSCGTDTSPDDRGLNNKDSNNHSSNETLSKLNVTFDKEKPEILMDSSEIKRISPENPASSKEEEEAVDDKSTICSDTTSDISTDDEAEDQVSMIICDVQRSPDENQGSKESLCDDSLVSKPTSSVSAVDQTYSDSLKSESETIKSSDNASAVTNKTQGYSKSSESTQESIIPKLITVLKIRQEEELSELKRRHEWEMKTFMYDLSRLSSSQIPSVTNAYESQNSSLNEIIKLVRRNVQNVAKFFGISKNQGLGDDLEPRRTSSAADNRKSNEVKKYVSFSPRQFEVGLDLVPTRESDGLFTSLPSSVILNSYQQGICKLQAIVKGKRIRKLMRTTQVQQLLSTLKEVAKLAHQFHQDILMDNIHKGDIGFHKALYNETIKYFNCIIYFYLSSRRDKPSDECFSAAGG
ncbi:hypothetical protein Avbf_18899 [Armadillidium vulgare]|nr:hypothetical protein Avbf_18899 [Armadillidium vulgare]